MAGQGLGPLVNKKPDIVIAPPSRSTLRLARRDSPTYDPYRLGDESLLLHQCTDCHLHDVPASLCTPVLSSEA